MTEGGAHFNDLIHPAPRLSIVALLAATRWADFAFVRDSVGTSDSALSKQISLLAEAGYVTVRKTGAGRTRRTRLQLSAAGRKAFTQHAAALRQIIVAAEGVGLGADIDTDQSHGPAPDATAAPEA